MQRSAGPLLVALLAILALAPAASAARVPGAPRCPVFPRDNSWNQRVDRLAVAPDSARIVSAIGLEQGLHADFGSGRDAGRPIGIPFDVVSPPASRATTKCAADASTTPCASPSRRREARSCSPRATSPPH